MSTTATGQGSKLEIGVNYKMTVVKTEDTGKTFQGASSDGRKMPKRKFIIHFQGGYTAEYCPEDKGPDNQLEFVEGVESRFKIIHRGRFGDEIIGLTANGNPIGGEPNVPAQQLTVGTTSMQGHPATIALSLAVQHCIAAGEYEEDKVLTKADAFHEWLTMKKNGL